MHYYLATFDLQHIRDAIAALDAAVFRAVNTGLAAPWLDPVMLAVTVLGEGLFQAAIAAAILLAGVVRKHEGLKRLGKAAFLAYAVGGVLSNLVKALGDRPRPVLVMFDTRIVGKPLFVHSFPSGHATAAFAAAFVFSAFLPKWKWLFVFLAALVAFSRVYLGVHFPLDVICGALLGALTGAGSAWLVRRRPIQRPAAAPSSPGEVAPESGT